MQWEEETVDVVQPLATEVTLQDTDWRGVLGITNKGSQYRRKQITGSGDSVKHL